MLVFDEYNKAKRMAEREYRFAVVSGKYPYLPALDEILPFVEIAAETNLGLVEVPLNLVVGTKTAGRQSAMASNFMPLLDDKSEFAGKWMSLLNAQEKEGIRDPILAFEYMNKFYVQEGNKRVSVLKYMKAASIPAYVTRIVPKRSNTLDNKIYYEFMDFYRVSQMNDIWFSREGSFPELLQLLHVDSETPWSEDFRLNVRSLYLRFSKQFKNKGGDKLSITSGDAFLVYLKIFGLDHISGLSDRQLGEEISKVWDEFLLVSQGNAIALVEQPEEMQPSSLWNRILPPASAQKKYKIAFIHEKTAETSSWTYGHELGRLHLEEVFGDRVTTMHFDEIDSDEKAEAAIDLALSAGCNLIFTTTPKMITASLHAAVNHPDVKILNCSVNTSYKSIRTYYGRMYEAKFLIGAAAASISQSNKIGYIADYPIYGMMANINAFALGAQMINPNVKIYLEWSTMRNHDTHRSLEHNGITFISGQDMITPVEMSRQFGLYEKAGESTIHLATPIWHWGKYYERILRSVMEGSWDSAERSMGEQALNYWWGMSADVIDVIYSHTIPEGTKRLIELLKHAICSGDFHPFGGILQSQDGSITTKETDLLKPEQIVTMNWLAANVIGKIPSFDELNDEAQQVVRVHGIQKKNLTTED
ncbi:MAG: BMP family ABC transporter substrate-binding protein [bacterium]|nr:BMP family ABC transporter substrate-binding protein [bacterium]